MAGERILVVDDEPTVLDACARALARRRYEVHTAAGGAEAMSRLDRERFDLLLTDIKMPDVSGLELVDYAREIDPDLPCVVLTGHGTLDTAIDSIRVGVSGFVVKPFTLQELMRAVDVPLEKARLARENIRLKALVPLFKVSHTLEQGHDFEALHEAMLTAARDGIKADACRLVLAPGNAPFLETPIAVALPGSDAAHDPLTRVTAAASEWWLTVARYFEISTEPLIVAGPGTREGTLVGAPDGRPGDAPEAAIAALERAGLREGIVVGLIASGQVLGALLIHQAPRSTTHPDVAARSNESDREWLGILGTLAGAALMRARLVSDRAASEERLQILFEAAACGLLSIDTTGQVTQANPMAENILGRTPGQMHGRALADVFRAVRDDGPEVQEEEYPAIAAFRSAQPVRGVIMQISRPDGQRRWLQTDAAPVLTPDGTLVQVVLSFVDVTDHKVAEEQRLELAREQAARGEAEEAVRARDEFLSVAAHELKTPIASMRLAAQLLLRTLETEPSPQPERLGKLSEMVVEQSSRMSRLVGQLLDMSRVDAGKLKLDYAETDIVALVEAVALTPRTPSDNHTIVVHSPSRPVHVLIDPLRIEQVLWNLTDNAIKYSPFGGVIDISVTQPFRDWVRLEVRDRGLGIAPDKLRHVFERFYQANDTNQIHNVAGLGLGLYISRQIVELHGGDISLESPPDGGTRVIVNLPAELEHPNSA
ncbi:MAG TPA: ATP-binding protein [Chloroflexota bacterium]|jgi:PAS domain S-box-containing protein